MTFKLLKRCASTVAVFFSCTIQIGETVEIDVNAENEKIQKQFKICMTPCLKAYRGELAGLKQKIASNAAIDISQRRLKTCTQHCTQKKEIALKKQG